MSEAQFVLEYFRLIISWPIAITVISMVFVYKFSSEISKFLNDACKLKVGQLELTRQSEVLKVSSNKKRKTSKIKGVTFTNEQIEQLNNEFTQLASDRDQKIEEINNKDQLISYLVDRAEKSEFAYFNLFLVPNTKLTLQWLSTQVSATKEYLKIYIVNNLTQNEQEFEAIFNALATSELIGYNEGVYLVSDKGKRFLQYLGLIQ